MLRQQFLHRIEILIIFLAIQSFSLHGVHFSLEYISKPKNTTDNTFINRNISLIE